MTWLLLLLPDHEAEVGGRADITLKPLTHRNKEKAGHKRARRRHGKAQLRLHSEEDSALVGVISPCSPPPGEEYCCGGGGETALQ